MEKFTISHKWEVQLVSKEARTTTLRPDWEKPGQCSELAIDSGNVTAKIFNSNARAVSMCVSVMDNYEQDDIIIDSLQIFMNKCLQRSLDIILARQQHVANEDLWIITVQEPVLDQNEKKKRKQSGTHAETKCRLYCKTLYNEHHNVMAT